MNREQTNLTGSFEPEFAGKLNLYFSAVDGIMRTERDDPTIGLLLCESHDGAVVEFSFKDVQKPIGVSIYTVTRDLPKQLEQDVPSVADLKGLSRSFVLSWRWPEGWSGLTWGKRTERDCFTSSPKSDLMPLSFDPRFWS